MVVEPTAQKVGVVVEINFVIPNWWPAVVYVIMWLVTARIIAHFLYKFGPREPIGSIIFGIIGGLLWPIIVPFTLIYLVLRYTLFLGFPPKDKE